MTAALDDVFPTLAPGDWPTILPQHLSASSLTMYVRCREQWRARYLEGRKQPPKGYQLWGTADSRAAEHNFRQKIQSHQDVPVAEVEEAFAVAVDELVDEAGGESQVEWDDGSPSAASVKDAGVKLAAAYHEKAAPLVQPVGVEQRIEIVVPDVAVPVVGYLDVETADVVVERKTAKQKFQQGRPSGDYTAQARVYQLATGKPVHWHVSTKTKLPAVYTPQDEPGLELPYTGAWAAATERWVASTVRAILADLEAFGPDGPWPGSRAVKQAPCGFCGYQPQCAWWQV